MKNFLLNHEIRGGFRVFVFPTERGECLPRRMDDDFLIRFLRTRNFNVNRAHRLVSLFLSSLIIFFMVAPFDEIISWINYLI